MYEYTVYAFYDIESDTHFSVTTPVSCGQQCLLMELVNRFLLNGIFLKHAVPQIIYLTIDHKL